MDIKAEEISKIIREQIGSYAVDVDVAAIRKRLGLSQPGFAHRFGFPEATLRHWEKGVRSPRACALALLHVIHYNPAVATQSILRAKQRGSAPEPDLVLKDLGEEDLRAL